jgi:hypothetical protein
MFDADVAGGVDAAIGGQVHLFPVEHRVVHADHLGQYIRRADGDVPRVQRRAIHQDQVGGICMQRIGRYAERGHHEVQLRWRAAAAGNAEHLHRHVAGDGARQLDLPVQQRQQPQLARGIGDAHFGTPVLHADQPDGEAARQRAVDVLHRDGYRPHLAQVAGDVAQPPLRGHDGVHQRGGRHQHQRQQAQQCPAQQLLHSFGLMFRCTRTLLFE